MRQSLSRFLSDFNELTIFMFDALRRTRNVLSWLEKSMRGIAEHSLGSASPSRCLGHGRVVGSASVRRGSATVGVWLSALASESARALDSARVRWSARASGLAR